MTRATQELRSLIGRDGLGKVSLPQIAAAVAREYEVPVQALSSVGRHATVSFARHVAIWCAWRSGQFSRPAIVRLFGGATSLVTYAYQRIEDERRIYAKVQQSTDRILEGLKT